MKHTIEFHNGSTNRKNPRVAMEDWTDEEVERCRQEIDEESGYTLPLDWKTGYPSFTVYDEHGEELGGG